MNENIFNMSIDALKSKLDKYNFVDKDLELFEKGKDFIDKAFELNEQTSNQVKEALLLYCIYKNNGGK